MKYTFTKTQKLTFSAIVAAAYMAIMIITQGFAFGAYQIRIATALYALAYPFPFLFLPLALANSMSNVLGGLGILDIVGGFAVGVVTAGIVAMFAKLKWPAYLVIIPIILGPGLVVPLWLSGITGLPYFALVINISIGQTLPAIVGYIMINELHKRRKTTND